MAGGNINNILTGLIVFWDETLAIKLEFHDEIADAKNEILGKKM